MTDEIYAYYTLRYDKVKADNPDTFGLDVAYNAWKEKSSSKALQGYTEFTTLNTYAIDYIIQRYNLRELSAETVSRWMWLADRLLTSLCTKYAGFITEYPEFKLEQHSETTTRTLNTSENGTVTNDLSQADHSTRSTSGTSSGETRNQKYADGLTAVKTASDDATVEGSTSTRTDADSDTADSTCTNTGTQNRTTTGSNTEISTKNINEENDTIMWQRLLIQRKSLLDMYSDEFNRLFIPVIGDDLYISEGMI